MSLEAQVGFIPGYTFHPSFPAQTREIPLSLPSVSSRNFTDDRNKISHLFNTVLSPIKDELIKGSQTLKDFYWNDAVKNYFLLQNHADDLMRQGAVVIGHTVNGINEGLVYVENHPTSIEHIIYKALNLTSESARGVIHTADLFRKPRRITPLIIGGAVLAAFILSACAAPSESIEYINPSVTASLPPTVQTDCNIIADDNRYDGLLFIGSHLGNNIKYKTYENIRRAYNCLNVNNTRVRTKYIPTTIIYDKNVLNDPYRVNGPDNIESNLATMKKYGLFPIIRVATSTNGPGTNWEAFDEKDAAVEGAYLAKNLRRMTGFPERLIIVIGNEQNLNHERGSGNPRSFARFFYNFVKSLYKQSELDIRTFQVAFPAPSLGVDGSSGISPEIFLREFFAEYEHLLSTDPPDHAYDNENMKPAIVAYNLYGNNISVLRENYLTQRQYLTPYERFIRNPNTGILTELGPITKQGAAYDDCNTHSQELTKAFTEVVEEVLGNPGAIDPGLKLATSACFNNKVFPLIANYNHGSSYIIDP